MAKITNPLYKQFLETGEIETLEIDHIKGALDNIESMVKRGPAQAKALLLLLYYTGARPNEVLKLRSKDITRQASYIAIQMPASKGGLARPIYIPNRKPYAALIWEYASVIPPDMLLFYKYKGTYKRASRNKKGIVEYLEVSRKLRYYIARWFEGVLEPMTPYYFRHNQFSKLAMAGASMEDIRLLKGSRSLESVVPYLHLSSQNAKKIGKKLS